MLSLVAFDQHTHAVYQLPGKQTVATVTVNNGSHTQTQTHTQAVDNNQDKVLNPLVLIAFQREGRSTHSLKV